MISNEIEDLQFLGEPSIFTALSEAENHGKTNHPHRVFFIGHTGHIIPTWLSTMISPLCASINRLQTSNSTPVWLMKCPQPSGFTLFS
jgi:hypothetical protein